MNKSQGCTRKPRVYSTGFYTLKITRKIDLMSVIIQKLIRRMKETFKGDENYVA